MNFTIRHEKRMHHNILCVMLHVRLYNILPRLLKKLWSLKRELFYSLQLLSETLPTLRPTEHYVINVHRSSCKVHIILVEWKLHLNFLDGFLKHRLIRKFMKIRPVGTELSYADGQTDGQTGKRTDRQILRINSHLSKFC